MPIFHRTSRRRRSPSALLLAGFAFAAACGEEPASTPGGAPGPAGDARPVPVEVATAELGSAARSITATGTVQPIRTITINSQLAGALLEVLVEEGTPVRPGTVLARIDSRELEAQLASAEAALEVARRAAERAERLRDQEIVTVAEYERDHAAYVAALATRDQLRTRAGYATVRSPITGVVLAKRVERGDIVGPQMELFTVGDLSTLVAVVPVSELDVASLAVGHEATVALDALPGRTLTGRIRRIFPSADTVTRLVPVEVALTGESAREARPGFLARITFQLEPRTGVLLVPAGAVLDAAGGTSLFTVSGGRAERRTVERGGNYAGRVEITSGLSAGDTVVVSGATMLQNGAAVRLVTAPQIEPPRTEQQGGRAAPQGGRP
ncbi:MAG TPA: efflux RND transporter periplasmic adaptor subunit [Gemmatimonadales bacterium]|nr:efflux RND transporter periplasmic adaptor subunit [Gemmatimonadales bacterium]